MKVKFAICDDSVVDSNYVKELVTQWANDKKYQVNIDIFSSAEAFIFHYVENKEYDVLLLDIEMGNMDGVTLARQIRKSNKSVQIVFITGYSDYIAEGYDVEALHYLMKPLKKEKLYDVLDRAVNKIMQNEKHLVLNTFDEMIRIPLHEIIYIDVDRNYVTVHSNKDYTVKFTIADRPILKNLSSNSFSISARVFLTV